MTLTFSMSLSLYRDPRMEFLTEGGLSCRPMAQPDYRLWTDGSGEQTANRGEAGGVGTRQPRLGV